LHLRALTRGIFKTRQEQTDHILLEGPPGVGKTAFAALVLNEIGDHKRAYGGQSSAEIAADLFTMEGGEALFVDEVHAVQAATIEILQIAMEGGAIGGRYDKAVAPWTLVAATTKLGTVPRPILDRFGLTIHLSYYPEEDICQVLQRSAAKLNMEVRPEAADQMACRGRGTPRIANRLLRRVRDAYDNPTPKQVDEILVELGIDSWGLETADRALLLLIYDRFGGGPVGRKTLAAASGLDVETVACAFEPYLLRAGLIDVVERGRQLTAAGYAYCKLMRSRLFNQS
jgi:Holliday junction DNA helicase RuvB